MRQLKLDPSVTMRHIIETSKPSDRRFEGRPISEVGKPRLECAALYEHDDGRTKVLYLPTEFSFIWFRDDQEPQ